MLKQTKMFIYRMIKSKSFYVIMSLGVLFALLTMYLMSRFSENGKEGFVNAHVIFNFYLQSGFFAMFLAIFTVIAVCSDFTSGYIKNIAGRLRMRWYYICSKSIAILLYMVLCLIVYMAAVYLFSAVFNVEIKWIDGTLQYILCCVVNAIAVIAMAITMSELFRKTGAAIALTIMLCAGLFDSLLNAVTLLAFDFNIAYYLPVGCLSKLTIPGESGFNSGCTWVLCTSAIYMVVLFGFSIFDFTRRDAV